MTGSFWYGHNAGYTKRGADYDAQLIGWNTTQGELNLKLDAAEAEAKSARELAANAVAKASDGKCVVSDSLAKTLNAIK